MEGKMLTNDWSRIKKEKAELSRAVFATGRMEKGSASLNSDIQLQISSHIARLAAVLYNTL